MHHNYLLAYPYCPEIWAEVLFDEFSIRRFQLSLKKRHHNWLFAIQSASFLQVLLLLSCFMVSQASFSLQSRYLAEYVRCVH